MDFDREATIYVTKLAEEANRFDDMAELMRNLAKMVAELTADERNLLSEAHKKAIKTRRASWKVLSRKLERALNETNSNRITEYRKKVEAEIADICRTILSVLNERLLPACTPEDPIAYVFYYKMKADFSRYLAKFMDGDDKDEVSEDALEAYEIASITARDQFAPTDPIRMGVALNYAVFYYELGESMDRACEIAIEAYREARVELRNLDDGEKYRNCVRVLKRLNENINLWKNEKSGETASV